MKYLNFMKYFQSSVDRMMAKSSNSILAGSSSWLEQFTGAFEVQAGKELLPDKIWTRILLLLYNITVWILMILKHFQKEVNIFYISIDENNKDKGGKHSNHLPF